jgi:hypothetical protein
MCERQEIVGIHFETAASLASLLHRKPMASMGYAVHGGAAAGLALSPLEPGQADDRRSAQPRRACRDFLDEKNVASYGFVRSNSV